jgi:polyphosphate glucokinase
MNILAIDIGGTNVKILATGQPDVCHIPSGIEMTPERMVERVKEESKDWHYDVIAIGFPGPVVRGRVLLEPRNLGSGWVDYDFPAGFGRKVKIVNDAAMQALGSYEGGRMLFLGLGTGLGSALIIDKVIAPMELAHLPYKKKRTFEDYVGLRGLKRLGRKKWQRAVQDVVARLKAALVADYVVLGGGNAKKLVRLPDSARLGNNKNAFLGGCRLWHDYPEADFLGQTQWTEIKRSNQSQAAT